MMDLYYGHRIPEEHYYPVQQVIDMNLELISHFPDFRVAHSNTGFLELWWQDRSHQSREELLKAIKQNRFEVLTGGVSDIDEAVVYYDQIIDNLQRSF
jgi:hypothetical protein